MAAYYTAAELRERLSPADLLNRIGHRPLCINAGYEHIYYSMLRPDKKGAFLVDTRIGLWYDHSGHNLSGIRSGDVIDLAKALYYPLDGEPLLARLSVIADRHSPRRKRRALKIPDYRVAAILPLGCTPDITDYLRSQGLWEISIGHLKEVHYFTIDQRGRRKDFCAAGWPNENGGWEVHAKNFDGLIGPSGMSFLPGDEQQLMIFYHFKDYLNWRYGCRSWPHSALVMNDERYIPAACKRAGNYGQATLYAGRELAGEELLATLAASGAPRIYLEN